MVAEYPRGRAHSARRIRYTLSQQEERLQLHGQFKQLALAMPPKLRREKMRGLQRQKKNLRRIVPVCPDSPWFTAKWSEGAPFPPGGDATLMRVCRACGRYTPPQCISARDLCMECQHDRMSRQFLTSLPSSPGTVVNIAWLTKSTRLRRQ
jgi:hypothetical protein